VTFGDGANAFTRCRTDRSTRYSAYVHHDAMKCHYCLHCSQYTFTPAENIYAEVDDYRQVFVVLISLLCKILMHAKNWIYGIVDYTFLNVCETRRSASADRTARRQFQVTDGQPVSWTQASDAMTSRLPRYDAKCVQRRCFQWGSVPLRSDIKGTKLPPANILIPLER